MSGVIEGLDLGDRVIHRPVRQDPKMAVFIANVCPHGDGRSAEPTLIIGRKADGRGRSFMVPLSSAWMYNNRSMIDGKAELAATMLFGQFPSKAEKTVCADIILQYLPELFSFAPDAESKKMPPGLQRLLEQHKVRITDGDGNVVVDASEGIHGG